MTQASQPFSVRACRAQPRPLQTGNFDEETVIRLKQAMAPTFSQMGGDAKALVDGFFTIHPDLDPGNDFGRTSFVVTLLRGNIRAYAEFDGEPSAWDIRSAKIDWRAVIQQTLDRLLGGEDWPVAFDLCEFLLAKHDEFVKGIVAQEESNRAEEEKYTAPLPSSIAHLLDHSTLRRMENARMRMIREDADNLRKKAIRETNETLERMNVGYRLREQTGRFDTIISPVESDAVDAALAMPFASAQAHMEKAVRLFSDRQSPDPANAVKEAVSAVESLVKEWTGREMRSGLHQLTKSGILPDDRDPKEKGNPFLEDALVKLWGYANKTSRHGLKSGESPPDAGTARFILVTCAAFVNYMTTRNPNTPKPEGENRKDGGRDDIPF